jgi:hypothetical protein
MYDKNDPSILWVSPSAKKDGDGTRENPFCDIDRALAIVKPGTTIVLGRGVYAGDTTFDISGTVHQPIRIVADRDADVEIRSACWFFYDVSDVIISGLTFRDAPLGAVSAVGACCRNRFAHLRFINCGRRDETACTLFFGGSGGSCNVVEHCRFERPVSGRTAARDSGSKSIGLMVSEGDTEGGDPLVDHVFRKNHFVNYDYGILIGTGDAPAGQYGHRVEHNTLEQCSTGGILVKCSDTTVRGNRVERCLMSGISIGAGASSIVESNRILDCASGIVVRGNGHTVANNCIVRCGEAIGVKGAASNILIESNTCVDNGHGPKDGAGRIAGVCLEPGATAVIRRNLFSGQGRPYAGAEEGGRDRSLVVENIACGQCEAMQGATAAVVAFKNASGDDFTNDSGYGACGWILTPDPIEPQEDEVDTKCCAIEDVRDEDDGSEFLEAPEVRGEEFDRFMKRFYSKEIVSDDTTQR